MCLFFPKRIGYFFRLFNARGSLNNHWTSETMLNNHYADNPQHLFIASGFLSYIFKNQPCFKLSHFKRLFMPT
ncbi:hypothetical protein XSR1_370030 [Xenorhabdus szentirmaii DSM 16338]|uniref:Uncharacterized protein n=1 Tax=Xenorhabdus szentirmaii DSM 16338 TaxID=1427518 RepID=W1J2X6_9GAMM|nr:hypothetical protein XSR1_370030 [Xenorhabdus szentirmaii DSM 16338]